MWRSFTQTLQRWSILRDLTHIQCISGKLRKASRGVTSKAGGVATASAVGYSGNAVGLRVAKSADYNLLLAFLNKGPLNQNWS